MFFLYYSILQPQKLRIFFKFTTLIFLSLITFQIQVSADSKDQLVEDYRTQGYVEQQKGNYQGALTFYAKALALTEEAALSNDMGVIYEQLGLKDKAEQFYLRALELNSAYLPPLDRKIRTITQGIRIDQKQL